MTSLAIGTITLLALIGFCHIHAVQLRRLEARIKTLEDATPKRLPYKAADEVLDAMAALTKELAEQNYHRDLIENAIGHLHNVMATGTKRE
jgi:hypothetical protein